MVNETGEYLGQTAISQALAMAEEKGLDLVEISPNANPPVCKILDYGKLRYEETRSQRKSRLHQKNIEVKEIRLSTKISDHDASLKIAQAQKFLQKGHRVHLVVRMKGREQAFASQAEENFRGLIERIGGKLEQSPSKVGNQISATIAPQSKE